MNSDMGYILLFFVVHDIFGLLWNVSIFSIKGSMSTQINFIFIPYLYFHILLSFSGISI